ncbi:hypothetical protein BJF90_22040 [Pseudonocardia sp. CNS-004]|nr:hypothetical protein BJF90_22040 [Pseudonocardia sp. CNS-004]
MAGEYSADTPSRGFTQRRRSARSATLLGYLHKDAVVVHVDEARRRRDEDAAAARRRGGTAIAAALEEDIGLWAALSGVDAIWIQRGRYDFDRQYLVGNRAAMLVDEPAPAGTGAPDWSGDGWVDCDCGQRHRGRHGAAGLLLTHRAADGTRWVLMQHRSAVNQHAGTWGLLGGARDYRESDERAAMREGWEEARIRPGRYRVTGTYVDDHGGWAYAWVLAEADSLLTPTADHESDELRWVRLDELHTLPLHPGFAAGWPAARAGLLDRARQNRSEPGGGAVALTPLTEADRLAIVDALLEQRGHLVPLAKLPRRMPRGPPGVEVLVLDGELPVPGVIAFGWADGRAVVITRRMLDEIADHLAAGRLDPGWWTALLVHERDFHMPGGHVLEHTGHRHDQDAAPLAEALLRARALRAVDVPEAAGAAAPAVPQPPSRGPAVSAAGRAPRGQAEPPSPMTGAGGARSPPPATVKIWYEKSMPRREFRWKAERLLELSADGRLTKAHNPVARDRNVTRKYRHDLVERIEQVIRPHHPDLADRLVRRVTVQMSADHVHELQLGGPDDAENLRMLDRLTNEVIGARQIQPQIHALPDGTPVRIEVVDIAELARRVARAVREDGRLTYLELVQRCAVSQAELRGAVRSDDSLRDVRHRAVEPAGDSAAESGPTGG